MKPVSFAIAFCLLSASLICSASAAPKFEAVTIQGGSKIAAALFRIEIATGKVVQVWGAGSAPYGATIDAAPLPPGEYHLYVSSSPQADGTVIWTAARIDVDTGRTWSLTGGGTLPYTWNEVLSPK